jgi:spore coat protein U-like protein
VIGAAALAVMLALAPTSLARGQVRGIHSCTAKATTVAFGSINGSIATGTAQSTGTVSIFCDGNGNNQDLSVSLSTGQGNFLRRQMTNGRNGRSGVLFYNLYLDAAHTRVWGDGTGASQQANLVFDFRPDDTIEIDEPVFGLIPRQVAPSSGAYADVIVVTLTF